AGLVRVRGSREGENVVISVKDNGPGVRPEDATRIFTPFFTTKGPGRGMGMGLTIAWRVVQSLEGTLELRAGPGAEFVLRLPRKQSRLRAVSCRTRLKRRGTAAPPPRRNLLRALHQRGSVALLPLPRSRDRRHQILDVAADPILALRRPRQRLRGALEILLGRELEPAGLLRQVLELPQLTIERERG